MSFFVTLIITFIVGDVLWWRSTHRHLRSRGARIVATGWALGMLCGLGIIIASRFAGKTWDDAFPRPVLSCIFTWHLLLLPLWLIQKLVRSLAQGATRLVRSRESMPPPEISRREFLKTTATFAPAILASSGAIAAESELEDFRVRRMDVPVAELPSALDGLTIVQVSDIHVGRFTRGAVLERIVNEANALDGDLTLLTGDLINFALRDLPAGIDLVRGLRARHGVFLCEGNHDLIENAGEFHRLAARSGIPLLRGEAETLTIRDSKVQIFGLPWAHGDSEHARAIDALDPLRRDGAFPILLAHHPHAFDFAKDYPLTLAGHTHGGQLMLNERLGCGPVMFRYWSGLYRRSGRTLVVSNGVGNWFPVRIAAPAELLHLTLRRA